MNNINTNNTLIIFGCSPYINEIEDKIKPIQNKYKTLGINHFNYTFKNCDYWLWSDYGLYTNLSQHIDFSNYKCICTEETYTKEIQGKFKPYFIFNATKKDIKIQNKNDLFIYKTSALPAINFAIKEGFKNVVLIGVDLNSDWKHYYSGQDQKRSLTRITRMREHLYNFKSYINIYKVNPNSDLDLEYIDIDLLINNNGN